METVNLGCLKDGGGIPVVFGEMSGAILVCRWVWGWSLGRAIQRTWLEFKKAAMEFGKDFLGR